MHKQSPFTALLDNLEKSDSVHVTLKTLVRHLADRGFGYLLPLSLLPSLTPIPGLGMVFGFFPLLLGVQMVVGYRQPWLPEFLLDMKLPRIAVLKFVSRVDKYWLRYVPSSNPSWPWMFSATMERAMGLLVVISSIVIIFPGPLTNALPSIPLFMLAAAITTHNGKLAALSFLSAVLFFVLLISLYIGVIALTYLGVTGIQEGLK